MTEVTSILGFYYETYIEGYAPEDVREEQTKSESIIVG